MSKNPIHDCDKCQNYDKCYPERLKDKEDFEKYEVSLGGCSLFKELDIPTMFGVKV